MLLSLYSEKLKLAIVDFLFILGLTKTCDLVTRANIQMWLMNKFTRNVQFLTSGKVKEI